MSEYELVLTDCQRQRCGWWHMSEYELVLTDCQRQRCGWWHMSEYELVLTDCQRQRCGCGSTRRSASWSLSINDARVGLVYWVGRY